MHFQNLPQWYLRTQKNVAHLRGEVKDFLEVAYRFVHGARRVRFGILKLFADFSKVVPRRRSWENLHLAFIAVMR